MCLFALYSLSNAFQWIQFAIIPNIYQEFYQVSASTITWTAQIYMITFIPLVFPATWLIERSGIKVISVIGSGLNAVGAIIKVKAN